MTYAYTHPLPTTGRAVDCQRLPKPQGLATRARAAFASLVAALTVHELPADRVYGSLLESSGGKLTDALEREADRRLRDG
jgi:hypothetical protein